MQEIRIEALSVEELQSMVRQVIREEVGRVVSSELNRILTTPDEDRLIPRSEAMVLLGVRSRTTIINLEKRGDLEPVRIGNRVSYSLENLREFKKEKA